MLSAALDRQFHNFGADAEIARSPSLVVVHVQNPGNLPSNATDNQGLEKGLFLSFPVLYLQALKHQMWKILYLICSSSFLLSAKRAIYIPPARNEPGDQGIRESYTKGTLFCLPIDSRGMLLGNYVTMVTKES
jgi:hypothetical protein